MTVNTVESLLLSHPSGKKKKEKHNEYLKAKWTRSSQKNNFSSPAAVRQPTARTTWPFFLPLRPPGVTTKGHCVQSGTAGTLGALLRTDGDRADSISPCSGRCQFVDFETESQGKHLALQILQNNNKPALFTCFLFGQKKSLFLRLRYIAENTLSLWHCLLGSPLRSVLACLLPWLLLRQKREELGLRTNENKVSGLRPLSNSALIEVGSEHRGASPGSQESFL